MNGRGFQRCIVRRRNHNVRRLLVALVAASQLAMRRTAQKQALRSPIRPAESRTSEWVRTRESPKRRVGGPLLLLRLARAKANHLSEGAKSQRSYPRTRNRHLALAQSRSRSAGVSASSRSNQHRRQEDGRQARLSWVVLLGVKRLVRDTIPSTTPHFRQLPLRGATPVASPESLEAAVRSRVRS